MWLRSHVNAAPLRGKCDTETLCELLSHYGVEQTLPLLDGMFAFAAYDRQEERLHLVVDRFAEKPLYVGFAGTALVAASDLAAVECHPDFSCRR